MNSQRRVPGQEPKEQGREFLYIEISADWPSDFAALAETAAEIAGPARLEQIDISDPSGRKFSGLSFTGDLEGWRSFFLSYCRLKSCLSANISDSQFEVSDGTVYDLNTCEIVFTK